MILLIALGIASLTVAVRLRPDQSWHVVPIPILVASHLVGSKRRDSVVSGLVAALVGGLILLAIELALGVLRSAWVHPLHERPVCMTALVSLAHAIGGWRDLAVA